MHPFLRLSAAVSAASIIVVVVPVAGAPIPVAQWSFDEDSGCVANSTTSSSSYFPGSLGPDCPASNSPQWTLDGVSGSALSFDGNDDVVTIMHDPTILSSSLTSFTLAAWIKHPTNDNNDYVYRAILDKRDDDDDGMDLYIDDKSHLFIRANTFMLAGHGVIADGRWHHVVGTYDGSDLCLYIDGTLDREVQNVGTTTIDTGGDLFIGRRYDGGTDDTFVGTIDEVAVYDVALTAMDVLDLYKFVDRPAIASLIGRWDLDTGSDGCVAIDSASSSSGGGGTHDGTLEPNCPVNGGPMWTQNRFGESFKALTFDGTDDAVRVQNASPFSPLTQITMTGWIQHNSTTKFRSIIDKRDGFTDGFDLYLDDSSHLFLRINVHTLVSNVVVADGSWHHVAATYDGNELMLYLDGELDSTKIVGLTQLVTMGDLMIGHHYSSNNHGNTFGGVMDELRIYSTALDLIEIQGIYSPSTPSPMSEPSSSPTANPSSTPTANPSRTPTGNPSASPSADPSTTPTPVPSASTVTNVTRIARWPFDEGTGCTTTDIVNGGHNNATLGPDCPDTSPTWTSTGVASNSALVFDGRPLQYVEVNQDNGTSSNNVSLDNITTLTISAWVQTQGPCVNNIGRWCSILDKRDSQSDGFDLYVDDMSMLFMRLNTKTLSTTSLTVGDGIWHHVVGTYDGTTMSLYVDGILDATDVVGNVSMMDTETTLRIGHHWNSNPLYGFVGLIDDVQIYNGALSGSEIVAQLRPDGPDLNAAIVSIGRTTLFVNETTTVEVVLSSVLPGHAFINISAVIELDGALELVPNNVTIVSCPGGGECSFDEAKQTLSYTAGGLGAGQSVRLTFLVRAIEAKVGAIVQWNANGIVPSEADANTIATLPNSDWSTIDIANPGETIKYYIDATYGDDANPGTKEEPFQTLQRCVDLWDGNYQRGCYGNGTFTEEVTFEHGGPTFELRNELLPWDTDGDGDLTDELFVLDGNRSQNMGLIVNYPNKPQNVEVGYLTIQNLEPDGGCDDDGDLIAIYMKCSGGNGCANWWIHHITIMDIGPECNVASHYIALQPSNMPNLVFEHNVLQRVGGFMMRYFAGDNITIQNNVFEINGTGLKAWGEYQDNLHVINNTFLCDGNGYNDPASLAQNKCGGQTAVNFANNIQNGLISGNTFQDCRLPINIGADERAGYRNNAHHIVERNFIRQTQQLCSKNPDAINVNAIAIDDVAHPSEDGNDIQVKDILFRNNVMIFDYPIARASQGAAIVIRAAHNFSFTSDIKFYHNTIRNYRWGVLPSVGYYKVPPFYNTSKPFPYQLDGVEFQNNIFGNIYDQQVNGAVFQSTDLSPPTNWYMDHNVYSGTDVFRWNGTEYTLSGWQSLGYDGNSILCEPIFADNNTLALSGEDGCARDRGENLTDVLFDREGDTRPMGASSDVGADEFFVS